MIHDGSEVILDLRNLRKVEMQRIVAKHKIKPPDAVKGPDGWDFRLPKPELDAAFTALYEQGKLSKAAQAAIAEAG